MPPKRSVQSVADTEFDAGSSSKKAKQSSKPVSKARSTAAPKAGGSKQSKKLANGQVEKQLQKKVKPVLPCDILNLDPEQQNTLNEQLFSAVRSASLESIKQLVAKGADPNAEDESGDPLLFDALGNEEVLGLLLSLGADPDCINARGSTLLQEAVESLMGGLDDTSLLKTLFEGGADPNFVNQSSNEWPPFWSMITNGEEKQIDLFLESGADCTTYDKDGNSLLSFLTNLNTDMVPLRDWELERLVVKYTRVFKSRGAKLSRSDIETDGFSNPLRKYLEYGEESEARMFVNEYKKGFRGVERPLHVAAYNPHMKCLKFLLKTGLFDVNEKDYFGSTALHNAARCENENNLRLLLEHGADPNAADKNGTTPFDNAKEERHHKHMDMLRRHGANSPKRGSDDDSDDDSGDYRFW